MPALRAAWPVAQLSAKQWQRAHANARASERSYGRELRRLYPYDLIQRNCVTEIFRTVEASFEPPAQATRSDAEMRRHIRQQSRQHLGGYVDTRTRAAPGRETVLRLNSLAEPQCP